MLGAQAAHAKIDDEANDHRGRGGIHSLTMRSCMHLLAVRLP